MSSELFRGLCALTHLPLPQAELKKQDVDNGIYYFGLGSFRKLSDHPKHSLSWGVHTISIKPARRKRRTLASSAAPDHDGTRPQSPAVAVEENPSIPPTDNPSVIVTPPEEQEEEQEDKEEDKEEAPSYPSPSSPFTSPLIHSLIQYRHPTGITLTSSWNTANVLDAKVELDQSVAKDVKLELLSSYKPANTSEPLGVKSNFFVKKSPFHIRAFVDLLKGPVATLDTVVGHEGFMVGGETSYDVQKATLTKYSAAVGYHHQSYAAAVTATNNFGSFAASYFHKVNSSVQAGTKATYDAKSAGIVGMELAGRYQLDPMTFVKVSAFLQVCFQNLTNYSLPRSKTGQARQQRPRCSLVQHKDQSGPHLWRWRLLRHPEAE